ncbi:hypothetical protein RQP46_002237 [Phenoliferia psychrophenolica]
MSPAIPGTKTAHKLDLGDIIFFPDAGHSPMAPPDPGETWFCLYDIIEAPVLPTLRPVYGIRDFNGSVPHSIAWYTSNPAEDCREKRCEVGRTLVVKDGKLKKHMDGQVGFRIENKDTVETFAITIAPLKALNARLRSQTDRGLVKVCFLCEKPGKSRCEKCRIRYCSKECQTADWKKNHKNECLPLQRLQEWNILDFDPGRRLWFCVALYTLGVSCVLWGTFEARTDPHFGGAEVAGLPLLCSPPHRPAGTETAHKLDLGDIISFPDAGHSPVAPPGPGETWFCLYDIVEPPIHPALRPVYGIRDFNGSRPHCVAWYTRNPAEDCREKKCEVGRTLVIKDGRIKQFMDGQIGFRIEDKDTVEECQTADWKKNHKNECLPLKRLQEWNVLDFDPGM